MPKYICPKCKIEHDCYEHSQKIFWIHICDHCNYRWKEYNDPLLKIIYEMLEVEEITQGGKIEQV